MAIINVEVPDKIAKKFISINVVQWRELSAEEHLLEKDWEWWDTVVDFGKKWVNAEEVLSYLKSKNG